MALLLQLLLLLLLLLPPPPLPPAPAPGDPVLCATGVASAARGATARASETPPELRASALGPSKYRGDGSPPRGKL
jgi:hypothetical protein